MVTGPTYTEKLAGARVLILGGTSGIGFSVAQAALAHGASVVIASSTREKLDRALDRLNAHRPERSDEVLGMACDLSSRDEMETNIARLLNEATRDGPLHHICFTAGDQVPFAGLQDVTVESIERIGRVRFVGAVILAKRAVHHLVPGPGSSITLTGGSLAVRPIGAASVVAAYCAGLEGLTRGLARELGPVRVNIVSPGAVHTEHFDSIPPDRLDDVLEGFRRETTVDRVGAPEDVAEAYLYSMRSGFVTGAVLDVNGGRFLV